MTTTMEKTTNIEELLSQTKNAFYQMATLDTERKNTALKQFADIIEANAEFLLTENQKDLEQAEKDNLESSLYQRLKLDEGKISQLVQGIRDLVNLPDPTGRTLSKTLLDDGLTLEKVTVPLGVIGIIFESRPDVIPQVLSLILKSGNAVVLKGGREANHSNAAFMKLVEELNSKSDFLPDHWAALVTSRKEVHEILHYPQYVDLIIPRGSNQLVQSIMESTQIPVLGHADGICHMYIHPSADIEKAIPMAIDSKAQYPSACNALETLLVDIDILQHFIPRFKAVAEEAGIQLRGCPKVREVMGAIEPASEEDWRTEYGNLTLAVKAVDGVEAAIEHINEYGSHHTDCVVAEDEAVKKRFLDTVDSACVFANASTRFADGFRFGLGAEIGISTSKTHARGPVGLEGLVSTKFRLTGEYQMAKTYSGTDAKAFKHKQIQ